ncbi:MAG: hypothetical protein H6698_04020 [Myxococcales bacterium]|nr:hypothetical protein [Myxococcales bacterium]MCB9520750.1 hypothetical protein [Myxococcales bacterium]MCB9533467.1 hypothetical protein [Myxococcales bacterium]
MRTSRPVLVTAAAFAVALGACEEPDTYLSLAMFEDVALADAAPDVEDTTPDAPDTTPDVPLDVGDGSGGGDVVECPAIAPSGDYLCALSANVAREKPLYLLIDFTLDAGTLTAVAQPVEIDILESGDPNPNRRLPAGGTLPTLDVPFGEDGSFELAWNDVTIVGAANPLTFRDIGGSFILTGRFYDDNIAYGTMGGEVTSPTTVPLGGSKFACQRTDDAPSLDPVYHDDSAAAAVVPCP